MRRGLSVAVVAIAAAVAALLAARGSSVPAQPVASITLPPPGGTKQLYPGCNNITLSFPDGTASETVMQEVAPADTIQAMWCHNAALKKWDAFSPAAPDVSDLLTVDFLDAVWLCVAGAAAVPTTIPPPGPTATPVGPGASATTPTLPPPTATPPSSGEQTFGFVLRGIGEFEAERGCDTGEARIRALGNGEVSGDLDGTYEMRADIMLPGPACVHGTHTTAWVFRDVSGEVRGTSTGSFEIDPESLSFTIDGALTVTGGGGRFAGVRGSGWCSGGGSFTAGLSVSCSATLLLR